MFKKIAENKSEGVGLLCCGGFTLIFCFHYIVAPKLLVTMSPLALGGLRGIVGGGILLLFTRGQWSVIRNWKQVIQLLGIGLCGFCLNQILMLRGLMLTHPANAAIFSNLIPPFSTAVGVAAFSVRVTIRQAVGLILGSGAALLMCGGLTSTAPLGAASARSFFWGAY